MASEKKRKDTEEHDIETARFNKEEENSLRCSEELN